MTPSGRLSAFLLGAAGVLAAGSAQHLVVRNGWPQPDWLGAPAAAPAADTAGVPADQGTVLQRRALRFVSLADGREAVLDAASGGLVSLLGADHSEQSFLRVTVRVLKETRALRHADTTAPFQLLLHDPDGLVLEDPLTRSRLAVRAFGAAAVANLLPLLTAPAVPHGPLPPTCPRLEC